MILGINSDTLLECTNDEVSITCHKKKYLLSISTGESGLERTGCLK